MYVTGFLHEEKLNSYSIWILEEKLNSYWVLAQKLNSYLVLAQTTVSLHLGSLFVLLDLPILAKPDKVESIILSIISMLSSPNDESSANVAAALQGTEDAAYIDLLRLFAYGTWRDYKGNSALLPKLLPHQILKLKQLTVLTLSETNKVLHFN
ncbi:hypothetical protein DKX38_013475 [Salix brachista]|uniref:PCI domain-containing protein n=1 Tax=Salix brachista TaxID=2182728 RepID=A0A5N5LRH8_9ROSI|nr:hypothetical protein DKX38_013475 [Salix brachista]